MARACSVEVEGTSEEEVGEGGLMREKRCVLRANARLASLTRYSIH